ncbi:TRAP transporter small permease [Martelella endophytica]|uniref:TRAP transporter small permease protein n=1 Tax=Martelella endophytica TaxID=1486262 RepID=A0A0D5LK43_MAREN|nr:TRAP transporter small permease [Martelella endophytica]AJY44559.1 C4-dicarboxylate ABC transporter permease [Martelella endophytica]
MGPLLALAKFLARVNAPLLRFCLLLGAALVGLMVITILIQVFFRYVLNDALAWTEELARFLMLWMVGLMAPTAFRHGGFVSIDMVSRFLPVRLALILSLAMALVSAVVLYAAMRIGWAEVTGIGGRFAMPALQLPVSIDMTEWMKVPRAAMMASLATGVTLMLSVNCEMVLRLLASLGGAGDRLEPLPVDRTLEGE